MMTVIPAMKFPHLAKSRMKAIATVSMYDMGEVNRSGLTHYKEFKPMTVEERKAVLAEAAEQRYVEFTGGKTKYTSGTRASARVPIF